MPPWISSLPSGVISERLPISLDQPLSTGAVSAGGVSSACAVDEIRTPPSSNIVRIVMPKSSRAPRARRKF